MWILDGITVDTILLYLLIGSIIFNLESMIYIYI